MASLTQDFHEAGLKLWARARAKAIEAGIAWMEKGNGRALQTLVLSALSKTTGVHLEATMNHFETFLARMGISTTDVSNGVRRMDQKLKCYVLEVNIRACDLFVWLLDMKTFEMCGQEVLITLGADYYPQSHFCSKNYRNSNALSEEQWLENLECVKNYLPLKARQTTNAFESTETKVFIWGEQYGDKPTRWPSKGKTVTQAVCGDRHVAFLTDVGQVITTGDTAQGQCGNGPSWTNVESHAVQMPGNVIVKQIAAGNTYTLCLTESNNVYYFGTCKFSAPTGPYNVPTPMVLFKVNKPTLYEDLKRMHIEQIASGAAHMLFLRKDFAVLSVGSPEGGRLGRIGSCLKVAPIHSLETVPVSKIGCGYNTSTAYCASTGQVFVWGRNDKMQCGIDNHTSAIEAPTELADLRETGVRDVVTGFNASYAITDKGTYSWGTTAPMPIEYFRTRQKHVVKIATGLRHTVALGAQGEVYTWGTSQLGQCGHGDTFTYLNPTRVYDIPAGISSISACGNLSIAFTGLLRTPLSEELEKCVNNADSFPDLIFTVGGVPIYAHKAMLIARCAKMNPKFLALLLDHPSLDSSNFSSGKPVKITETHSRSAWNDGVIPTVPSPEFQVTTIAYDHTLLDGTAVDAESLTAVLRYIYTDVFSSASSASKAIAADMGLTRLQQLLGDTTVSSVMPSTYMDDIDCLIHTPPDCVPKNAEELAWASKKGHFKNLIGAFSDLTLTAIESGVTIYAHRFLLCCRSEFFTTLLKGPMAEAKTRCVSLETDESTIKWLLRFLYTDRPCTTDINVTVELLKIGAMLQMSRLVFLCSRFIEKELDTETTAYMYHLTATHSITLLRDVCWALMIQDFDGIVKTQYWKENLTQEERDAWTYKFQHPTATGAQT